MALLAIGACRQIFGLDEAVSYTPDTAATDAGAAAAGSAPLDPVTQMASDRAAPEQSKPLLDDAADAAPDAAAGEQQQLCDPADPSCAGDAGH